MKYSGLIASEGPDAVYRGKNSDLRFWKGAAQPLSELAFDFLRHPHDREHFSVTQAHLQIFRACGQGGSLHSTMWMGT
jgi:hypothetical protein